MAAEVPLTDVLCEAMEYLSKLGSNLQTRSTNLKEKRIRKDKLKNNHAVQKAASKVLLICELSKKSLDNVETGVRKVLSILEASKALGGNNSDSKSSKSNLKYYHFEYKSHKLRIAKRIPLKHYMSAKVLVRGMPVSMQEKYPVYYDCKLKRQRKVAEKLKRQECKYKTKEAGSEANEKENSDDVIVQNEELVDEAPDNISVDRTKENVSCEPKDLSDQDSVISTIHENMMRKLSIETQDATYTTSEDPELKQNTEQKKNRVRFVDVYSSDSDNEFQKSKSRDTVKKDVNLCSNNEKIHDSPLIEPKSKKLKLTESDGEGSLDQLVSNNRDKADKLDDSNWNQESESNSVVTESTQDGSQNESGTETKPVIRCVNISKLLKPDTKNDKKDKNDRHKTSDEICNKLGPLKNVNSSIKKYFSSINKNVSNQKKAEVKRKQKNSDEEYWAQKRKEVSKFKPKEFSINIERLPNLSVNFLLAHKLKRIIVTNEKGCVVSEIGNETDTPSTNLNDLDSDTCKDKAKTKRVKESLLKDSDSDTCEHKIKTKKLKESLLEDSDSKSKMKSKKSKKSDYNGNNKELKKKSDADSIKEYTLLMDSDAENNVEEEKSDSRNSDSGSRYKEVRRQEISKETKEDECYENAINTDEHQSNHNNSVNVKEIQLDHNDLQTPTKINQEVKSSLLNDSSDEKNDEETSDKTSNQAKSSLLNSTSDEESVGYRKNIEETLKSSLLRDSSDENGEKTPKETNNKRQQSPINSPPSEDFAGFSIDDQLTPTKIEKVKSSLLNDSSDEKQDDEESPVKTNKKSSSLNDSSDDKQKKSEEETPTKTNQKIKSSLLKDSSDEKSCQNGNEPTKENDTEKAVHNETSDVITESSDDTREKRKTPKYKRKNARKNREAKKKIRYSSSSDSEQEIPKQKRIRKKSVNSHDSNGSDNGTSRMIDQFDGAEEHSNISSDKMVRSKAKPSGSSSQSSDNQDANDKDIDRLTNLNSINKNRQRDSSTKSREDRDSLKRNNRSKATSTIGEALLKAESSSEVSDDAGNVSEEDLPEVTLPGLNGDIIEHMAHEDLLGESESSISPNEKDQSENAENMDETDEEEKLRARRRKANAISSDSEGGSNRHKEVKQDERMSDFEDSEDSETGKKSKRKKRIVTDSDASDDSNEGGKKKRRRIKQLKDSDASGSDTENEGRNKHGRKNIRKVMGKNQLEEATKKAAREEKERVARIMERQKLYNNLDFDESGKPDEVVLEKVVLDFDPETKEPWIQVDRGLVKKLKPHQANGIKFMWDACFESVKRIKKDRGSGCILAHCMGLGKTLQVISLTHTLLTHNSLTGVNRVLVVCPLSTVLNWVNEIRMWLKHAESDFEVDVYELSRYKQNSERAFQLQQWLDGGGVCVLGYEMFRNLSADNNKKFKKKMLRSFQESLVDPGPDLVVCDEGHLLKNEKTSLSQSMNRVKTQRRIVLTGTPLQNNLKEYYCMVQFVKPNLLGKYNEYLNRFVNPITNGQYTDSTEHDIRVMKRRSHVLHKMLDGAVQRRDYGVLAPFLPPKHEYVLFITLSDVQVKLYEFYLENYSRRPLPGKSSGFLFPDFQSLQRIWTHPLVLKYNSERYEIMQQKKREREEEDSEGSLVDFIDDDSTPEESSTEESSDDLSDVSDDSRKKSKKKKSAKKSKGKDAKASTRRGTRANPVEIDDEDPVPEEVIEAKNENPTEWWIKLVEESELEDMRNSHKLVLLFDILRQCETIGDKLLVFSQSLYSLDLIEHFLGKVDEATQEGRIDEKLGGHVGSWSPGVDYFRLDGSTSCENRSIWCKNFNREDNPRARLFLISTRAGGLGINLVAANRVVIFDVSWNPSHDVQSIFRVYRFGQKKPCYVYRFLAMGTMEEKIYERQVTKQAISKRVIDEQQIDRHYAENDLAELYKFEARPQEPRPLPTLPKDRLFAEMLREHEPQIYKYHEHDSLLENKEEETLSEEERKAAWEDFENEKNKPPPAPFPSVWPMHNGMVPGLLAQQQQQLAYAALAATLRKDIPNLNDNQIRDMLPLIYNSNPGLMQKMNEIYKYAQPGMMNPSMMNPVMNAGSGGGGMGGTSGLQYEPPWQRQHQQQQQMRLQQIMQQQNQMGAKFYAGGLGSRDPVAMALQQQRAREIMMGGAGAAAGAASRPRGRPPIHPRLPTSTSQDVVNLDSD